MFAIAAKFSPGDTVCLGLKKNYLGRPYAVYYNNVKIEKVFISRSATKAEDKGEVKYVVEPIDAWYNEDQVFASLAEAVATLEPPITPEQA